MSTTLSKQYQTKLANYFLGIGFSVYKHGWFKGTDFECPFCGKVNKFGVNVSKNWYHCFRCGEVGDLIKLVKEVEGVETSSEVKLHIDKYQDFGYSIKRERERAEVSDIKPAILPEGFRLVNQGDSQISNSIRAYVKKRGFNIDEVSKMGWGYTTSSKYFGYLIIPYYKNGEVVYFNARNFLNREPKYLNPDIGIETSVGKSLLFYNEDALELYDTVILCEGAINATTISKEKAICSAGKSLSAYQINLLIKSQIRKLIICLDDDAIHQAFDLANKLIGHKVIKIVQFPKKKDINDLGRNETMKLIYQTNYLKNMNDLIKLKNEVL